MSTTAEAPAYVGSGSEGCLLVAGSYSDIAPFVSSAVAEAATRIMRSPILGDFIEIRFVDLGSRPRRKGAVNASAIPRIVRELLNPPAFFDRNYFAFAVIDKSAGRAEKVLSQLTVSLPVAALPIRQRGLAAVDDRKSVRTRQNADVPAPDDLIQALGSLSLGNLASALRSFAREAMLDFADGREHGLTHAELRLLSPRKDESEARENPEPAESHGPDPGAPGNPRSGPARRRARDRPAAATGAPGPPAAGETDARPDRLVLLVLDGDQWPGERDASRRRQATLLELDRKIGELPQLSCSVHALTTSEDAAESHPRKAGQLSRRDISPSPASLDFARCLEIVRSALKRDLASVAPRSRPLIVFFAADPPFADPVAAQIFGELAAEASVAWVLPEQSAGLLSPAFAGHGAHIITDRETAADDIIHLLQEEEREAGTSTAPSPSPDETQGE